MSILTLPEPAGWQRGQRRWGWAAAGFLLPASWLVWLGLQATLRGHYLTTVVVFGLIAPFVIILAAQIRMTVWPPSLRVDSGPSGTALRPDIWMSMLVLLAGLALIPGAVVCIVFVPRGDIDIPMSRGTQVFSPILMVCALWVVISGLVVMFRRGGVGFLRLSPSGLENTSPKEPTFVAWNDVLSVDAGTEKRSRKAIVLSLEGGRTEVIEGLDWYAPGGSPYWMVRHYWKHPEDRVELIDERALERLREGRFDVD